MPSIATDFYPYCGVLLPQFGHLSCGKSKTVAMRFVSHTDHLLIPPSDHITLWPDADLKALWEAVEQKMCSSAQAWTLFMRTQVGSGHVPAGSLGALLAFDALLFLADSQGSLTGSYEFPVHLDSVDTSVEIAQDLSWVYEERVVHDSVELFLGQASAEVRVYLAPASMAPHFAGHSRAHSLEENPFIFDHLAFSEHAAPGGHVVFLEESARGLKTLLVAWRSVWARGWERMRSSQDALALAAGKVLGEGRYEVVGRIGSGGFAVVYEAIDRKFGRTVAIKVITLDRSTDDRRGEFVRRFEREGQFASQIKHKSVVEVYDVGVIEETATPYIVMERLQGMDLSDYLKAHGPLSIERALPLFVDVLEGLGVAHEKGIVHKDLKPSNVFLCDVGRPHERLCVLDFGVARQEGLDTSRLTRTDGALGTPHYMAPEYASSQIATPALDVYQVGLILIEALTARPVVSHPEPMAAMFQHVRGELYVPNALLDSPLGPLLRQALDTDHEARFVDGFAFAKALRAILGHSWPTLGPDLPLRHLTRAFPDAPQTPRVGQGRPPRPLLPDSVASEPKIAFADTVELSLATPPDGPPLKRPPQRPSEPTAPLGDDDEGQARPYPSRAPYVALSALLLCLLGLVVWLLIKETERPKAAPRSGQVVTEYDLELQQLRRRAEELPQLLERGELERMLREVEAMDRETVRLTPQEVDAVRGLVDRAKGERKNRERLTKAMTLLKVQRNHEAALAALLMISPDSVFRDHQDFRDVLDRVKIALLPRIQQYRYEKRFVEAERLLSALIMFGENEELVAMHMELNQERTLYEADKQVIPARLPEEELAPEPQGGPDGSGPPPRP